MTGRAFLSAAVALLAGCGEQRAAPPAQTEAQRAYTAANAQMHGGMAAIDPDPDIAFAQGMTAHHRGAIEMAKVEQRYGRDPELRALAKAVIAAQGPEIAQMERWLARRGAAAKHPASASGAHRLYTQMQH